MAANPLLNCRTTCLGPLVDSDTVGSDLHKEILGPDIVMHMGVPTLPGHMNPGQLPDFGVWQLESPVLSHVTDTVACISRNYSFFILSLVQRRVFS